MFSVLPTDHLLGPKEMHGVATPMLYLTAQRRAIEGKIAAFPHLNWRRPFEYAGPPIQLKVSESCWQLICECGNYPLYDPEWQLAACFSCGAIYRQAPPDDWQEIQRVLVQRPDLRTRHMLPGETVEMLKAQNRDHGVAD